MPAQMIFISKSLAQTLGWVVPTQLSHVLAQQGMRMEAHYIGDTPAFTVAARVDVLTPIGIDAPTPIVLTFCHRAGVAFVPDPLPAPLVRQYLLALRSIIVGAPFLSGHERLELNEAFDTAEAFPVAPLLPLLREQVTKSFQWRHIARGKVYGAQLSEPLARFDTDLHDYDPSVGTRPCLGLVSALSWQGGLADHLAQQSIKATNWPAITGLLNCEDERFLATRERSERLIEAADTGASELEFFSRDRFGSVTAAVAQLMHQHAFGNVLPAPGAYRQHDGGIDPVTGQPGLPHPAIPTAFRHFTQTFGRLAWPDCHPIIRAGLAHLAYARMRPFEQGNDEVGRLLFSLMLQDRAIPELPLDLILARHRAEYRAAISAAFTAGDVLGFLRFLIRICHQALQLGAHMACVLRDEVIQLTKVLCQHIENPRVAEDLAIMICSRMIVEDHHIVFALPGNPDGAVAAVRTLAREGLIDETIIGEDIYWSSPRVRLLLEESSSSWI